MSNRQEISYIRRLLPPILLLLLGLGASFFQTLDRWDRIAYDSFSTFISRPQPDHIAIIAIDDYSLSQYGRWPWERSIHGELIDKLSLGGAKAIGVDILFTEPDTANPKNDQLLAEAIERSGKVFLPVVSEPNPLTNSLQLVKPIPIITKHAAGLGHVDFELDRDGMMRRVYLKAGHGKPEWDALALSMLRGTGISPERTLPGKRNQQLHSAAQENWIRDHEILLPFAGEPGHYQTISYAQFMDPEYAPSTVDGKFVLVGTTAMGLGDALPTPVSGQSVPMAGVEINANLLDVIEQNLAITPLTGRMRLLITALLILLPLLFYPRLSQKLVQVMLVASALLSLATSIVLLLVFHLWYSPVTAILFVIISYPVWAWRRLEQLVRSLFEEKEKALVTLHSIGDGVITTDRRGWVQYMNPVAEKIVGYKSTEVSGKHIRDVLPIYDEDIGRDNTIIIEECVRKSEIIHLDDEAVFSDPNGKEFALKVSAGPIADQHGKATGVVLGISDVTEKRQALRELSYRATHDVLTGLANRSLMADRLNRAISRAEKSGKTVAVLFIDLDNFKKVNDQIGHDGGDKLLKIVATILSHYGGDEITISRLGGDEFVILLEEIADSTKAANYVKQLLSHFHKPILLSGHEFFITASVGVSLFPRDGKQTEQLLKCADIAMYEVKKQGRNNFLFFSQEMNAIIQEKLEIESALRKALLRNELQLNYQPQVAASSNQIVGVEALVRWNSLERGTISPGVFIPIAEESDLILQLSEWIIHTACKQARTWQDQLPFPVRMSVNLSPRHFLEADLPDQLDRFIKDTGVNRQLLDLEITEGLIMQDVTRSIEILQQFKDLGSSISIDDFGTGYSSLAYLKQFPLDKLKIDQSFVKGIDKDVRDKGLAHTIITMGHNLNLQIVAEGVENRAQLQILREQKCDIIQGYLFSPPVTADILTERLLQSSTFTT